MNVNMLQVPFRNVFATAFLAGSMFVPQSAVKAQPKPEPEKKASEAKAPENIEPGCKCTNLREKQRAEQVAGYGRGEIAFRPRPLYLPPVFMTDAERSYYWIGVLYFEFIDVEADTKTRLLPPFFLSLCNPESETFLTPLFGYQRDAEGIAGLILSYYWRRDRLADSDVCRDPRCSRLSSHTDAGGQGAMRPAG